MNTVMNTLTAWLPILQSGPARDDAYLAAAVDHVDLEQRLRTLEARSGGSSWASFDAPAPRRDAT
jgi:hypothetical protein